MADTETESANQKMLAILKNWADSNEGKLGAYKYIESEDIHDVRFLVEVNLEPEDYLSIDDYDEQLSSGLAESDGYMLFLGHEFKEPVVTKRISVLPNAEENIVEGDAVLLNELDKTSEWLHEFSSGTNESRNNGSIRVSQSLFNSFAPVRQWLTSPSWHPHS